MAKKTIDVFQTLNREINGSEPSAPGDFPAVPVGFAHSEPALPVPQASQESALVGLHRSDKLEKLVDNALEKIEELLQIPLIPGDEDFIKLASMQKDLVVSLVNTGIKVDENRFKKRQGDALAGILDKLLDREKELGPLIDADVSGKPN